MPTQHPARKTRSSAAAEPANSVVYLAAFYFLFAVPLFFIHLSLIKLPFYWDELGQFIPTALDLLRTGAWVAHSTIPNVHPPGVEAYLVLWYKIFGFSIPVTRVAMLLVAACGLLFTFLLAIELSRGTLALSAFIPPILLMVSPLFYTQSMLAQLDMPAMVLTLLALWLFLKGHASWAAVACVALVLVKETGIVTPFVLFLFLAKRRDFKRAALFIPSALALALWLAVLHHATGYWLGNPGFAHYNVGYALNPVRMIVSLVRRIYYIFFAEFRWIGTLLLVISIKRIRAFRLVFQNDAWQIALAVSLGTLILVSVFGGAELERYLMPVLPVFYIAVALAIASMPKVTAVIATAALSLGLLANLFWNPPYPFPFENNYSMVDFVRLQQLGADFLEHDYATSKIATAWPYTAALQNPDYGFVHHKLQIVETSDFHLQSIRALPPESFDVLITYTRTWTPEGGLIRFSLVRNFLSRYYDWQPDITFVQCSDLGLQQVASWSLGDQDITIYARKRD